jgi:Co/Zn/Cd efflux system component
MHETNLATWQHSHAFGLDQRKIGERRTLTVALLTAATMVVEVVAGLVFGSMALLADGLHMASHATALGIAVLVYVYDGDAPATAASRSAPARSMPSAATRAPCC